MHLSNFERSIRERLQANLGAISDIFGPFEGAVVLILEPFCTFLAPIWGPVLVLTVVHHTAMKSTSLAN